MRRQVMTMVAVRIGALIACALLLSGGSGAAVSQAAIAIHQHPQKAAYASPAEWPFVDYQLHWRPSNAADDLGHIHIGLRYPLYGELTGAPIVVPFSVKLFKIDGEIVRYLGLFGLGPVRWDACGCPQLPPGTANGDPAGLREWTGEVLIDPATAGFDRGWWKPRASLRVLQRNGDRLDAAADLSLYVNRDPSAPERRSSPDASYRTAAFLIANSARQKIGANWGANYIELLTPIPLAPISATWNLDPIFGYDYGWGELPGKLLGTPPGFTEARLDPDLHNGVDGALLARAEGTSNEDSTLRLTLDPAVIGLGDHKLLLRWSKETGAGTEAVAPNERADAIIVVDLTVGNDVPLPPPPPTVTWTDVPGTLQQGSNGTLRFCPAAEPESACVVVVKR